MASQNLRRIISLLLTYLTITQICSATSNSAEKVKLDLYYESLCPYSADFIINDLAIIFQNGIIDIVDLRLFPWGNAKLTSNNSFTCQHGPNECLLNTVEACAIHAWPNLDDHFPFITCVESLVYEGKYYQWETCFKELGLDPEPITDCYKSEVGKKLELKYAALTDALKPPHKYVPWVVVDGKPLLEDFEDFITYICKAYKGPKPSACNVVSFASVITKKTSHVHPVSYTEQTIKATLLMKMWSFIQSWMDLII
ncbi:gamma-interferon-inducible lysosomal thiol reductase-like isoform X1 [Chenopodium quinoa]|uniref:gamma-interferon-inducible lysosomal thiol reductase-like isoform X1 n=1 Tax=Chenopodium quinoa TaxID=63459 RepID=UPI000B78A878|nr:gamma-interferon-inducible lysosomal thiol reductase-like isoform X1 [Chenopodium quinoa]